METNLKKALKVLNLTQDGLSELTGVSKSKIRNISAGRVKVNQQFAELVQQKTGISAIWLQLSKGDMFGKESGSLSESFEDSTGSREQIQYYPEVKAQAGNGYINSEESEIEVISLPKSILDIKVPKSARIDAIKVHGDSMHPTIKEDDIIFIIKNVQDVIDNKIYVIRYGEDIRVKRLFKRMNNNVLLRSDNNIYPDEEVNLENDDVQVLGQVIYNIANLS